MQCVLCPIPKSDQWLRWAQVCRVCTRDLSAASYHRSRSHKDGLTGKCKDCCVIALSHRSANHDLDAAAHSNVGSSFSRQLPGGGHEESLCEVRIASSVSSSKSVSIVFKARD